MPFETDLPSLASNLDARLRHATPHDILRETLAAFGPGKVALVSSFGAESAVLLHMVAEIDPGTPVLFLDTGMLFAQTLDYRRALVAKLRLTHVRDLRPTFADLATVDPHSNLWQTDTDACCHIRKVVPLAKGLESFDAWITGRKQFQSATRAALPVVERGDKIKINPLANWSKDELNTYAAEHDLPAHPLVQFGYPSIGCWPCTKPVTEGQDERAGRWAGSEKIECGIHTPGQSTAVPVVPFDAIGDGL